MNYILCSIPNWLMILTFSMAAVCFLFDTHMDDRLKVKEACRFGWALAMLICLYSLYMVALEKSINEHKRYEENQITGITIKL